MFYKETAVGPITNIVSRCVITHGWTGIKNIIPLKFLYFLNHQLNHAKELTLCNKLWFSNPYIFGFQRRKPLKFQTMTFVRSNNISLKYQRFTTMGSKDIGIRKSEFVAKSQFIWVLFTIVFIVKFTKKQEKQNTKNQIIIWKRGTIAMQSRNVYKIRGH